MNVITLTSTIQPHEREAKIPFGENSKKKGLLADAAVAALALGNQQVAAQTSTEDVRQKSQTPNTIIVMGIQKNLQSTHDTKRSVKSIVYSIAPETSKNCRTPILLNHFSVFLAYPVAVLAEKASSSLFAVLVLNSTLF